MTSNITDLDAIRTLRERAREEPVKLKELPMPKRWLHGEFINHDALMETITKARNSDPLPSRIQIGWRVVVALAEDSGPFTEPETLVSQCTMTNAFEAVVVGVHFGDTHEYYVAVPLKDGHVYAVLRVPNNYVLPMLRNADK